MPFSYQLPPGCWAGIFSPVTVSSRTYRLDVLVVSEENGAAPRVEGDLGRHKVDAVARQALGDVVRHEDRLVDGVGEHVLRTEEESSVTRGDEEGTFAEGDVAYA